MTEKRKVIKKFEPECVTLVYRCEECNVTAKECASYLVESGTAICNVCDQDMILCTVEVT